MSRAGYIDDYGCDGPEEQWALIRYRGAVKSAFRGARGQAFLRELLAALDAMPEKRLIAKELEQDGEVCALGCVGRARGMDQSKIDPEDYEAIANAFGIAAAMAREIEFENDDDFSYTAEREMPEQRWSRVRAWVAKQIT